MKNPLVMIGVGVGLTCVTVAGLLGVQGRLNYDGTRHIPLVRSLFAAPKPIRPSGSVDSRHPKAGAAAAAVASPEAEFDQAQVPLREAPKMPAIKEFAEGELLRLVAIESSDVSVADVNRMIEQSQVMQRELARERAAVLRERGELEGRERDLAQRVARLEARLLKAEADRVALDASVAAFRRRVLELPEDEVPGLRDAARTLTKLMPEAAAEVLDQYWRREGGPDRVAKLLAVMNQERADEILACFGSARVAEILARRMAVLRVGTAGDEDRR